MPEAFTLHSQLAADSFWLADWPLCQVRLINDKQYPWFLLIPRVADMYDIIDLSETQQQRLLSESTILSHWIRDTFKPVKLNVAALGNQVRQLHIHHIARFETDIAWPAPVWGKANAQPYTPAEREQVVQKFHKAFEQDIN